MKIAVCLKQVPSTETKIKCTEANEQKTSQIAATNTTSSDTASNGIDTRNIKWIINPYDEYGIEESLQIQSKRPGSTVTAICLGPKSRVTEALRTALAMGVDQAVCIDTTDSSRSNPLLDTGLGDSLTVAKLLFKCVEKIGPFDLIFMGKMAIDDQQSAVGPMLAALLNIPHASVVSQLECHDQSVTLQRDIEGGSKEVIEMQLPALIGVSKGLNTPRYTTLPGIMKAKRKPLTEITPAQLGVDINESLIEYSDFKLPLERPLVQMMEGDVSQQVTELVKILKYKEKIL